MGRCTNLDALRIGREIWVKGVSLEFMLHIAPQVPFFKTKLCMIRHRRGDIPTYKTFFFGEGVGGGCNAWSRLGDLCAGELSGV